MRASPWHWCHVAGSIVLIVGVPEACIQLWASAVTLRCSAPHLVMSSAAGCPRHRSRKLLPQYSVLFCRTMTRAVRAGILRESKPVQRVIGERLVAAVGCVFVIEDAANVAVVDAAAGRSVSGMEVIADAENTV